MKTARFLSAFVVVTFAFPASPRNLYDLTVSTDATTTSLLFYGEIMDNHGSKLVGAQVQFWQADTRGIYDHSRVDAEPVPTFQYFGTSTSDSFGQFFFKTHRPGEYATRPSHIHFRVVYDDVQKLMSQFYFSDEKTGKHESLVLNLKDTKDVGGIKAWKTKKAIVIDMGVQGGVYTPTQSDMEGPYYREVGSSVVMEHNNDLTTPFNCTESSRTPDTKIVTKKKASCEGVGAAYKSKSLKNVKKCKKFCKKKKLCYGFLYIQDTKMCSLYDSRPTQVKSKRKEWCGKFLGQCAADPKE